MKALAIISGVSFLAVTILVFVMMILKEKIKRLQADIDSVVNANNNLHKEIQKLSAADEIKQKNRSEANEKIKSLDDGNSVSNALDVLRDKKS